MKRNRSSPDHPGRDGRQLEADVHDALRAMGCVVPQSEGDVLRAEQELVAAEAGLPGALQDPAAVLYGRAPQAERSARVIRFPPDPDIGATLARAAREGAAIPPEIEEAMRRDREAAEREGDNGSERPES